MLTNGSHTVRVSKSPRSARTPHRRGCTAHRAADGSAARQDSGRGRRAEVLRQSRSDGQRPQTIRTYRAAVNGFVASYKKPYIEDYERQNLIDYMGWLKKQPQKERKHANPDRTYFNKVSHVAIFLRACGV